MAPFVCSWQLLDMVKIIDFLVVSMMSVPSNCSLSGLFILGGFGPLIDLGQLMKQLRPLYFACLVNTLCLLENAICCLGNMEALCYSYHAGLS
jgi:hypothetical protein